MGLPEKGLSPVFWGVKDWDDDGDRYAGASATNSSHVVP
ncbi:hypothetical protein SAMN06264364_10661 [Quadrisphaera granulorum]|uniref:Uncharacterized protein n=1 Tax=Quadrisphaera granulorum TaxID=317664 RepID=A0A316ABJ1_9ACTN|nr:hypothetical protein BXY45_10661 [Quadrisphaera granulorum]SZE95980.1 hypothetical protein SAMN06264364_10661 [Quadrisphaera granulorum]